MKIWYERVSTFEQKLESQIEVLKEAGAEEVFQEKLRELQLNAHNLI